MLSIAHNTVPQILNLTDPEDKDLNFAIKNVEKPVDVVLQTALAFGGINSALVYQSFPGSGPRL